MEQEEIFAADKSHDGILRSLMRSIKVPGAIELMYAREPSYFHGLETQGHFNQTCICMKNGEIAGIGCRSIRPMYINGTAMNFGYLGGLRAVSRLRGGITKKIFEGLGIGHADGRTPGYITTVIEGNTAAWHALVNARPGMPAYIDFGRCYFHAINVNKRKKPLRMKNPIQIKRADQDDLDRIIEFLNREGKKRQFSPVYEKENFSTSLTRDFSIHDFYIALDNGDIVGVTGKWDQSGYKQIIVSQYHGILRLLRPFVNVLLNLFGYQSFPNPGDEIKMFTASFVCIKENSIRVMKALLDRIYQDNRNVGYHYMLIAFHESDPLRKALKSYYSFCYISRLYLVRWEKDAKFCDTIRRDMISYLDPTSL